MVCFVPIVCLSIRKSCQRRDCSELGTVRNWVDHCRWSWSLRAEGYGSMAALQSIDICHRLVAYSKPPKDDCNSTWKALSRNKDPGKSKGHTPGNLRYHVAGLPRGIAALVYLNTANSTLI